MRCFCIALIFLSLAVAAGAQMPGTTQPSVVMAPVPDVSLRPGGQAKVEMAFRIGGQFHINSNKPKSPLLIPTALTLTPGKPVQLASVQYPPGEDQSFAFAPDEKLSVYSGDFAVNVSLKAPPRAAAGVYLVKGELHYQACDRNACYPPKSLPLQFKVIVK